MLPRGRHPGGVWTIAIDTAATDEPGDDSEHGYVGQEITTGPGAMQEEIRRDRDQVV